MMPSFFFRMFGLMIKKSINFHWKTAHSKISIVFQVMERIEQLFDGFSDQPPFAFVFCGNFLSRPTANLYINDLSGNL